MPLKDYFCIIFYSVKQELFIIKRHTLNMEMELPKQINNINERVVDDLKTRLPAHSRICVAAASFSMSVQNG